MQKRLAAPAGGGRRFARKMEEAVDAAVIERSLVDVAAASHAAVAEMLVEVRNVPEVRLDGLQESPMIFYKKLAALGEEYGAVKLLPPSSWNPPLSLDLDAVEFKVNLQRVDHLANGRPFEQSTRWWTGAMFAAVATRLHEALAPLPPERRTLETVRAALPPQFLGSEDGNLADGPLAAFEALAEAAAPAAKPPEIKRPRTASAPKRQPPPLFLRAAETAERESRGKEQLESLERVYWRMVETQCLPLQLLYASDIPVCEVGSCFPLSEPLSSRAGPPSRPQWLLPTTRRAAELLQVKSSDDAAAGEPYGTHWFNLQNFARAPGSLLEHAGLEVSGVTCPWLYIGMIFSSFCWHTEDNYWGACNYHHLGAPKVWYVVPATAAPAMERALQLIGRESKAAAVHGMTLQVPLTVLRRLEIPFFRAIQRTGEFVLLWPRVFHAGFNLGLNVNEACNAAPAAWLPLAGTAERNYRWLRTPCVPTGMLLVRAAVAACKDDSSESHVNLLAEVLPPLTQLLRCVERLAQQSAVPRRFLVVRAAELRAALRRLQEEDEEDDEENDEEGPTAGDENERRLDSRAVAYLDEQLAVLEEGSCSTFERLAALAALPCPECAACRAACFAAAVVCVHSVSCVQCREEVARSRRATASSYERLCPGCDTQVLLLRFRHADLLELLERAAAKVPGGLLPAPAAVLATWVEDTALPNGRSSSSITCRVSLPGGSSDLTTKLSTNVLYGALEDYVTTK